MSHDAAAALTAPESKSADVAVPPAAVADDTTAASPTASITAIPIDNTLLRLFIELPDVVKLYHDAGGRYLSATKELKTARSSLDKFKASCTRRTQLTLPRSLQLRLVEHAVLPAVPDIKTFHDATTAALRAIEATTTKATYDTLVAAKEAYIKHLEQRSNAHAFIITAVNSHRDHVAKYAEQMDASFHFPSEAAVAHFEQHLRQRVQTLHLQAISTAMREKQDTAATHSRR